MRSKDSAVTVSPGRGSRSTLATRSRLTDPTTVISGGKRAQIVDRALEVLAQVEQTGPERGTVGGRLDARHVCKALEGADECSELEVGLGNGDRRRAGGRPGAHPPWTAQRLHVPSARAGGRRRAPTPRTRRAARSSGAPSPSRRAPRACRPSRVLLHE